MARTDISPVSDTASRQAHNPDLKSLKKSIALERIA